jgi:hypothetical protein
VGLSQFFTASEELSRTLRRSKTLNFDAPQEIIPNGPFHLCYAEGMIEFSQPAQCLFCPQRRKIALLLKLILAGSAAIIVGLFLFLPRGNRAQVRGSFGDPPRASVATSSPAAETVTSISTASTDAASQRSLELRDQARKRFLEVQAQVRSDLSGSSPNLRRAENLISARKKEVLMAKLLVLGEEALTGAARGEAQKKLVLDFLNTELDTLNQQSELISKLEQSN